MIGLTKLQSQLPFMLDPLQNIGIDAGAAGLCGYFVVQDLKVDFVVHFIFSVFCLCTLGPTISTPVHQHISSAYSCSANSRGCGLHPVTWT